MRFSRWRQFPIQVKVRGQDIHVRLDLEAIREWGGIDSAGPVLLLGREGDIQFSSAGLYPWSGASGSAETEIFLTDYVIEPDRHRLDQWLAAMVGKVPLSSINLPFAEQDGVLRCYEFFGARCVNATGEFLVLLMGREKSYLGDEARLCPMNSPRDKVAIINALKSNLIGNISHELRTPLNGILGAVNVLNGTDLVQSQEEMLRCIDDSVLRLQDTVSELTDYAAMTSGFWDFSEHEFPIESVIEALDSEFRSAAEEKQVSFRIRCDAGIPAHLYGDEKNLVYILRLLLGNAIKFTEKGTVSVHIHNRGVDETTAAILVEVLDTGVGIDDASVGWICDPFRQVDSTCSREYSGLGLGLAIGQILAFRLGTRLSFESCLGEGSRFWIPFRLGVSA